MSSMLRHRDYTETMKELIAELAIYHDLRTNTTCIMCNYTCKHVVILHKGSPQS